MFGVDLHGRWSRSARAPPRSAQDAPHSVLAEALARAQFVASWAEDHNLSSTGAEACVHATRVSIVCVCPSAPRPVPPSPRPPADCLRELGERMSSGLHLWRAPLRFPLAAGLAHITLQRDAGLGPLHNSDVRVWRRAVEWADGTVRARVQVRNLSLRLSARRWAEHACTNTRVSRRGGSSGNTAAVGHSHAVHT